ncbi:hypothetical protein [Phenylobacterium aquaticum]|uniref:hypothetical protein n=1 Tax=Phenylobacterium aquaticum TaxID=1763816 RepID=UPI001F5D62C6|nr:hypothetical protein [Phenylobacterium aquaticum]MCI3132749.1 hypothetical protein [Phenylobacterium aquaticum]
MTRSIALILAAALASAAASAQAGAPKLSALQAELAAKGPAYLTSHEFNCDNGTGYKVVAGGDPAAVALGVQLIKSSASACASEGLIQSLAKAMQKNPSAVLPYVDTGDQLTHDLICLPLGIEEPVAVTKANIAKSTKAISAVSDPKLATQKAACLASIAQTSANLGKAQ